MADTFPSGRSLLDRLFFSPDERRLRAGWRLLIHLMLLIACVLALSLLLIVVANFTNALIPYDFALSNALSTLALTTSIYLARRFLDRRSFISLGLERRQALADVGIGILIAGIMMTAIYLVEWALGWLTVEAPAWQTDPLLQVIVNLAVWFGIFAVVGWQEELLSRGYWLQNIAEGLNLRWGVVLSSVLFALLHLGNPNVSWVAILGLFAAGLFLAYGYIRTRQLWLSIGLHIGWNFFEGNIFGFQVSGLDTFRLLRQTGHGPEVWTGGAFGPEAGLIVLPALALGTLLIYSYTRQRPYKHSDKGIHS